jgi:hypothetical protein
VSEVKQAAGSLWNVEPRICHVISPEGIGGLAESPPSTPATAAK